MTAQNKVPNSQNVAESDHSMNNGDQNHGGQGVKAPGDGLSAGFHPWADLDSDALLAALSWQVAMGIDEAIGDNPIDRFELPSPMPHAKTAQGSTEGSVSGDISTATRSDDGQGSAARRQPERLLSSQPPLGAMEAIKAARDQAAACQSLAELRDALNGFDGCDLRLHATQLVHFDGAETADIMIIGEAPGRDEDLSGTPFVGRPGKLLDKMLVAIGIARETVHITNTVFWRPPGNRTPTDAEVAVCAPFLTRQIELVGPKIIVCLGASAAKSIMKTSQGIMRIRGKWQDVMVTDSGAAVATIALCHPETLLRNPGSKRLAWRDLIAIKHKAQSLDIGV